MKTFIFLFFSLFLSLSVSSQIDSTNFKPIGSGGDSVRFNGVWYDCPSVGQSVWFYTFKPASSGVVQASSINLPSQVIANNFVNGGTYTDKITRTNRIYVSLSVDSVTISTPINLSKNIWFCVNVKPKISIQNVWSSWGDDADNLTNFFQGTINAPSQELLDGGYLPVDLISFTGIVKESIVELKWTTASEINSQKFILEKSYDCFSWKKIAEISSAGNSNQKIEYSSVDKLSFLDQSVLYYRLSQYDFDGRTQFFNPISVSVGINKKSILFWNGSYYEIHSQNKVYDLNGKEIIKK